MFKCSVNLITNILINLHLFLMITGFIKILWLRNREYRKEQEIFHLK